MTPDESPAPPPILDYELLRLVGRGSYGDVWLARGVTGVFRAVKIVWRQRFVDAQPFEREFRGLKEFAAVSLTETRQLALLHVGRNDAAGFFYYVMELADDATRGREIDPASYVPNSLREVRARRGRLPAAEVVAIGTELARGLAGLHTRGLVHRDIKPSNVIIVGGQPKLADIGLVANASAALTFVGTEGYVPPEGPGAPAADVFSLGKLLYELATGLDRHDYPRLPPDFQALPDRKELLELNEVLIRACEPDATKRHRDATGLLEDLLLLQAGKSVRRLRAAERRLARALRVAALLTAIAGVAGVGAWIEHRRAAEELARREQAEAERDAIARRSVYYANLAQAERSLAQGDFGRARQMLESSRSRPGETELRRFEWHALMNDARGDLAVALQAAGGAVQRVRISPASPLVAVSTTANEAILWDVTTGKETRRIQGVGQMVGFSDDGRWLLGVASARLRRWRVAEGTLDPDFGSGASWAFGPDREGRVLALSYTALGQTYFLRGCDPGTGKETWRQPVPFTGGSDAGNYYAAALSPDGRRLALALTHLVDRDVRWRILVLALPEMTVLANETTDHRPSVLAWGPDQDALLVTRDDLAEVGLFSVAERKWRWLTPLPMNRFTVLAIDGGNLVGVGGRSGSLALLNLADGRIVGAKRGHTADVQDAVFLPDGRLVSGGSAGDVRLWPANTSLSSRELPDFWHPSGGGRALTLSADGGRLAATAGANRLRVVSVESLQTLAEFPGVAPVQFTDAGHSLWTINSDGFLEQHAAVASASAPRRFSLPLTPKIAAASSDERWIAVGEDKGRLLFFDVKQHRFSPPIDTGHDLLYWVALSRTGRWAATSGRDLTVRIWDVVGNKLAASWKNTGQIVNGAFAPDTDQIVLVQGTGAVELREITGREMRPALRTSSGILQAIAFHPFEPRLFLGGRDGLMHVIDTQRWEEVAQLPADLSAGRAGTMARAATSANGTLLAGYSESGTIRLWRRTDRD